MVFLQTFLTGCAVLTLFHAEAQVSSMDPVIAAGKLWVEAKYFHPALAYRDIDWDGAWVKAFPSLRAASNAHEYERAVNIMLGVLNDSLTTTTSKQQSQSQARNNAITWKWETGPILVITVRDSDDWNSTVKQLQGLSGEIPKAQAIIFDLRPNRSWEFLGALINSGIEKDLASRSLTTDGVRKRLHSGLAPVSERFSGIYYSAFQVAEGRQIQPNLGFKDVPVAFVVDERSPVPEVALALQAAGNGWIVSEGSSITDRYLVNTESVHLPYGIEVNLRTEELVNPDGTIGINPDEIVLAGEGLKAAMKLVAKPFGSRRTERPRLPIYGSRHADRDYPEPAYPAAAYRTMAALRIWGAYHYFYPYKDLIGEDWDGILGKFWPEVEASRNAREYNLTIAEMVSHVHDSHAFVDGKQLEAALGPKTPDIHLRWIEDSPVVTRLDKEDVKSTGIAVGDVIIAIGGQDVEDRIKFLSAHISASTPQALMAGVCDELLGGPAGSSTLLTLRKPDGHIHQAKLLRRDDYYWKHRSKERTGDIVRTLADNIGYADLDRLPVSMVDEMFEKLKNTHSIVFDMRGYPLKTAWAIAPRLTQARSPVAALIRSPILMPPNYGFPDTLLESRTRAITQTIPTSDKWRYKNPTVMLIDERTMSQSRIYGAVSEGRKPDQVYRLTNRGSGWRHNRFRGSRGNQCTYDRGRSALSGRGAASADRATAGYSHPPNHRRYCERTG